MIRRDIAWCNNYARDDRLRCVIDRATLAEAH
jgi:hypothetical protein